MPMGETNHMCPRQEELAMMVNVFLDEMTTTGSEGRDDVQRRQLKQGEGDILYTTNLANNLAMESGKTRTSTTAWEARRRTRETAETRRRHQPAHDEVWLAI